MIWYKIEVILKGKHIKVNEDKQSKIKSYNKNYPFFFILCLWVLQNALYVD